MNTEQTLRQEIFIKFGSRCKACGFNHPAALQIDHVFSDGKIERQELDTLTFYKKVLSDIEGRYQLLCASCNILKKVLCQEYRPRPPIIVSRQIIPPDEMKLFATLAESFTTAEIKRTLNKHSQIIARLLNRWSRLRLIQKKTRGVWIKFATIENDVAMRPSLISQ